MLYGAASMPSLQHTVVALAALHESMVAVKKSKTLPGKSLGVVAKSHLRRALEYVSQPSNAGHNIFVLSPWVSKNRVILP